MTRFSLLALLAMLLAACGPGETGTPPSSTEARAVETPDPAQPELASAAAATLSVAASDPVASVQASLDADNHQITPVFSRAPDSAGGTNNQAHVFPQAEGKNR
ncbi:hypothetical protein B0G84_2644 [Paraburkholderia sp. BL8N3]|jgi:PBP1b-binding outer membrane lipoprotein LpoB|nr:hypothetical protein [Paraburkholderia sp. BL8N3]TCK44285.1 hypothetical protein B0G84_2644 [Paraburkholderia sp. BL8N3]